MHHMETPLEDALTSDFPSKVTRVGGRALCDNILHQQEDQTSDTAFTNKAKFHLKGSVKKLMVCFQGSKNPNVGVQFQHAKVFCTHSNKQLHSVLFLILVPLLVQSMRTHCSSGRGTS